MKKLILATAITAFSVPALAGTVSYELTGSNDSVSTALDYEFAPGLVAELEVQGHQYEDPSSVDKTERDSEDSLLTTASLIRHTDQFGALSFYGGAQVYNLVSDKTQGATGLAGMVGARYIWNNMMYITTDFTLAPSAAAIGNDEGMKSVEVELTYEALEGIYLKTGYRRTEVTADLGDQTVNDGGYVGFSVAF